MCIRCARVERSDRACSGVLKDRWRGCQWMHALLVDVTSGPRVTPCSCAEAQSVLKTAGCRSGEGARARVRSLRDEVGHCCDVRVDVSLRQRSVGAGGAPPGPARRRLRDRRHRGRPPTGSQAGGASDDDRHTWSLEGTTMSMSKMGLAARRGTAVEPTCSLCAERSPRPRATGRFESPRTRRVTSRRRRRRRRRHVPVSPSRSPTPGHDYLLIRAPRPLCAPVW